MAETEDIGLSEAARIFKVPSNPGRFVSVMLTWGSTHQCSRYRCPNVACTEAFQVFNTHDTLIQHLDAYHSSIPYNSSPMQGAHPTSNT